MNSSPSPQRKPPERGLWSLRLFLALVAGFSLISVWLLAHGHSGEFNGQRWAKVLSTIGADGFRLEDIGLLYPHAPIYLLALFRSLPGMADPTLPYFLSALCVAATFTLWNTHLRNKGYAAGTRLAFVALVACHPFVLWSATAGFHNALTLLMFYLFCYGCYLVICLRDVRSLVFVSMTLAVFFFTDERTLYIFLALLPLIPLLAPRPMMEASTASVYGVLAFPVTLAIGAWFYLNWIFHGEPSLFLDAPEASFRGAWHAVDASSWLLARGGEILSPLALPPLLAAAAFPLPLWLLWRYRGHDRFRRAAVVLFMHPVIAIALATTGFYLAHPVEILFLLAAVAMSLLLVAPRQERSLPLLALLAAGNLGGWVVLAGEEHADVRAWRDSLLARASTAADDADRRLGEWLRVHRAPTLLDDRAGYRAIAARGDAAELLLPHQEEFKRALRQRDWAPAQVALVRPSDPRAALDAVTRFAPGLYWHGMDGYRLVFDDDPWRVYRRVADEGGGR